MDAARLPRVLHRTAQFAGAHRVMLALLAFAVLIRVAGLGRPLVGNFATRSAVHAMIARNWARGDAPLWQPTLDRLAAGRPALHLTEWPVSAYLAGGLWRLAGGSLDAWGRGVSIAWSTLAVAVLHRLLLRHCGSAAALSGAAVFALSPVSVVYGQSFMLEPSVAALSLVALECLDRFRAQGGRLALTTAATAWALLLLTKPFMAALALPLAALWFGGHDWWTVDQEVRRRRACVALAAFAVGAVPCSAWLAWVATVSAADSPLAPHLYYSLRESAVAHAWPSPLWISAEFYTGIMRNLATVVLTPLGLALAALGCWRRLPAWLIAWLGVAALLALALPRKFHEMNYYYLAVLPPLCALAGLGWQRVTQAPRYHCRWAYAAAALLALASARWSIRPAFMTPAEDRAVTAAAAALRSLAEPDDRVVAMHGTTLDLLYYCDRRGWSMSPADPRLAERLAECGRAGAALAVVAGPDEQVALVAAALGQTPAVVGDGFACFRLDSDVALRDGTDADLRGR